MRRVIVTVADAGNGYDIQFSGTSEYSRKQIADILRAAASELMEVEDDEDEDDEDEDNRFDSKLYALRDLVYNQDIPHPTVPEYVEFHTSIQRILKFIDTELLMRKEEQ